MNIEELREYCLSKSGAQEVMPFRIETLVFKVGGKIFMIAPLDDRLSMTVKCEPERGLELRAEYAAITPAFHMNKKHWITVSFNGSLTKGAITGLIDNSYRSVLRK